MRFEQVQDLICTGDLLLFRPPRVPRLRSVFGWFVSWFIGLHTRSIYSHVGVAYRMPCRYTDRLTIFEATAHDGIRIFPMDKYIVSCAREGYTIDWYQITDPKIDGELVAAYCRDVWGGDYVSKLQMFLSFVWLGKTLRKWLRLPTNIEEARYFCSQLTAAAFKHAGYLPPEGDETDPALTDPGACSRYTCLTRKGTLRP